MANCYVLVLLITTIVAIVKSHLHHENNGKIKSEKLINLEQKWKPADFVRDFDHVKEDLSDVITLQQNGEINAEDMLFYMFRMHDFDDNEHLDGLELMNVIFHGTPEVNEINDSNNADNILQYVIEGVDSMFRLDLDNDGFLSYAEMKQQFANEPAT